MFAQTFNVPVLYTANQFAPAVLQLQDATYLVNFIGRDGNAWVPLIQKYGLAGNELVTDSVEPTGWPGSNLYQPTLTSCDIINFSDSVLYVYGSFAGCDVVRDIGYYIQAYDRDLNRLHSVYLIDSTSGDCNLLAVNDSTLVLTGIGSVHVLDANLSRVYYQDHGVQFYQLRGDIVPASGSLLRNLTLRSPARDSTFLIDLVTGAAAGTTALAGQFIQINDSVMARISSSGMLYLYNLPGLSAIDSLDLNAQLGFTHSSVHLSGENLIFSSASKYAVVSTSSLGISFMDDHRFTPFAGDIWSDSSQIRVVSTHGNSIVGLEAFPQGAARAPIFDSLSLAVNENSFQLIRLDTVGPGVREIRAEVTWQIRINNHSADTLRSVGFSYRFFSSFNCGGDNLLWVEDSLSVPPGDSTMLFLELNHLEFTSTADFNYFLHIRPVMANNNLLQASWLNKNMTVKDIGVKSPVYLDGELEVFPNPCRDYLTIRSTQPLQGEVRIIHQSGQVVLEHQVDIEAVSDFVISVGHLTPGFYFVVLESDQGRISRKLLKK